MKDQKNSEPEAILLASSEQRSEENVAEMPLGVVNTELGLSAMARTFSKTSIPLILIGSFQVAEDFGKTAIISQSGSKNIAVDALLNLTFGIMLATDIGFLMPVVPMISDAHGRGAREEIGQIVRQGWLLGGILSLPTMGVLFNTESILNFFGQDPELTAIVGPYARLVAFAAPAVYLSVVDGALLKSTSRMKNLVVLYLASACTTLGISALLVPGNFGLPNLGIMGVGYAILIKEWGSWLGMKLFFLRHQFEPYKLYNFRETNLSLLKEILCKKLLKFGSPLSIMNWCEQGKAFLIGIMMGRLGSEQLAINQVSDIYLQFLVPPILGIRQGAQILIGQQKGMREYSKMKRYGNLSILLELSLNTLPLILYATIPYQLTNYFIPDSEIDDVETFIRLTFITKAVFKILEGIQSAASENLKGTLDIYFPVILQFVTSITIVLPLSYLLAFISGWDLIGFNAALCIGSAINIPPLLYRWNHIECYVQETPSLLVEEQNQPSHSLESPASLTNPARESDQPYDLIPSIEIIQKNLSDADLEIQIHKEAELTTTTRNVSDEKDPTVIAVGIGDPNIDKENESFMPMYQSVCGRMIQETKNSRNSSELKRDKKSERPACREFS